MFIHSEKVYEMEVTEILDYIFKKFYPFSSDSTKALTIKLRSASRLQELDVYVCSLH
jgi:hypothetical protein